MRSAGKQSNAAHHRADQTFDMSAVMRLSRDAPDDLDAKVAASSHKCATAEVRSIVRVQGLRKTCNRPWRFDLAFLQPDRLVVDRVQ